MKRVAAFALLVTLAACDGGERWLPAASAYRNYGDRLRVYLYPVAGMPCGSPSQFAVRPAVPVDKCFRFGAQERIEGVLVSNYGSASLYLGDDPSPDDIPVKLVSDRYRLYPEPPRLSGSVTMVRFEPLRKAYRISFFGRRLAARPPSQGQDVIVVDRIERIERASLPGGD